MRTLASATAAAPAVIAPANTGRAPRSFANPVVPAAGSAGSADPSVVCHNGFFYYCRSVGDTAIGIARARRLGDLGRMPMKIVWNATPGSAHSAEIWAPELQFVGGQWMIYFAASDGDNANHRMLALRADTPDPFGSYTCMGRIAAPGDHWAIDGIAIQQAGALYFVWSGWREHGAGFPQVLYIAPMSDPWTICGERVEIAAPEHEWEQRGAPLLEAPAVLYRDGRVFIAYSASASWTDDYAIGILTLTGTNPLDPRAWAKRPEPAFARCDAHGVWGPGHNSFMTSPDGTEDWMVYHAIDRPGGGWGARSVRAQRIGWHAHGSPDLGLPTKPCLLLREPSAVQPARRRLVAAASRRSAPFTRLRMSQPPQTAPAPLMALAAPPG